MKKASAILCGDIHIREKQPLSRTDVFMEAQWEKLSFIKELQEQHLCPVLCSGDFFDVWNPSLFLLSKVIDRMPNQFYTVYGQHDLPFHNKTLANKCGLWALQKAGKVTILYTGNWGDEPPEIGRKIGDRYIHIWHKMTYKTEPPFPGCVEPKARSLLYKYPQFDLIVTGDNHEPFTQTYEGRLLVNVGSMMRTTAKQIDYKPAVWLWYADTNTVEKVYLPIKQGVVSREHIEEAEVRDSRIDAFIDTLNKKGLDFVNFEQNLDVFMQTNRVRRSVKELTYKLIGK